MRAVLLAPNANGDDAGRAGVASSVAVASAARPGSGANLCLGLSVGEFSPLGTRAAGVCSAAGFARLEPF
jgi:hypothetical protein